LGCRRQGAKVLAWAVAIFHFAAMRKQVKFAAVLLVLSLIGAASWHLLHFPEAEPVYEGKKLTVWLEAAPYGRYNNQDEWMPFDQWMRAPEKTRFLIRALKTRDNQLRRPYLWIRTNAPTFFAKRLPVWIDPERVRISATDWLGQLGPTSKGAVSILCAMAVKDPSREVRRKVIWALARIDLESEEVRKVLVTALSTDADRGVRAAAAGSLEMSGLTPTEEIMIAFVHGLTDSDPVVREICAAALGKCGSQARPALETLQKLANSDDEAADYARSAMRQIEAAAPVQEK